MNNILEKADGTLHDLSHAPLAEVRSLFFQTLFALYVGQTEYELMHNDLHAKVRIHNRSFYKSFKLLRPIKSNPSEKAHSPSESPMSFVIERVPETHSRIFSSSIPSPARTANAN